MTTGSIFWFVVFAASGGVLVFVGLLMELFSEKDWHNNLSDFRHCKFRKVCGEWFVIGGIVIEIVVGIFSAIDAWENNPLNQPIKSLRIDMCLGILGTNFDESQLQKGSTYSEIVSGTDVLVVPSCDKYESVFWEYLGFPEKHSGGRIYSMTFNWPASDFGASIMMSQPRVKYLIDRENVSINDLDSLKNEVIVFVPSMKRGSEISRLSSCVVTYNGSIIRRYTIPEKTDGLFLECPLIRTNSP